MDSPNIKDVSFEDAAEELQLLRERLDAERAIVTVPSAWLAAQAAMAKAMELLNSLKAAAVTPTVTVDADDGNDDSAPVVAALVAPPAMIAQMARELKIVAVQAMAVWEVLLWAAGCRGPSSQDATTDVLQLFLVTKELEAFKGASNDKGESIPPNKVSPPAAAKATLKATYIFKGFKTH